MFRHKCIRLFYKNILKKVFFLFDPENVHDSLIRLGNLLGKFLLTRVATRKLFAYQNDKLKQNILGLDFINPVGLAAGFDKNAKLTNILPEVGFGHYELGSVTLESYIGNPKPRLYRLKKSKGLVVYYGLMNDGIQEVIKRIKESKPSKSVLGVSVAKTNCDRTADETEGINDYYKSIKYLEKSKIKGYYTINISCPNTFGGEPFTTSDKLERLLKKVYTLIIASPVFIKMPINLSEQEFDSLLRICVKYGVNGVVIGNLTKVRDEALIQDEIPANIQGGISGKPTWELCNNLISYTYKNYKDKLIIIGVGGIFSAEDAYEKIKLGASLVQLITGMIFEGPQLIGEINHGLVKLLEKDGYKNVSQAVGAYHNSVLQ